MPEHNLSQGALYEWAMFVTFHSPHVPESWGFFQIYKLRAAGQMQWYLQDKGLQICYISKRDWEKKCHY